jgi:hypothetical protein
MRAVPPTAPQKLGSRGVPSGLLLLAAAVLGFFVLAGWLGDLIPGLGNPFSEQTVDRSGPAVLKSIRNLSDFRAATGHFEVIVDVEKDTRFVPDKLKGERVLFVAVGSVDAGVDFSGLEDDAVVVSDDRRSVTLELPPARYHEPQLDLERSRVYDRDRGVIDRLQSLFGDDAGTDPQIYTLAEEKLAAAARDGSGLLNRAERNTRLILTGLLRSLGFTRVEIHFAEV